MVMRTKSGLCHSWEIFGRGQPGISLCQNYRSAGWGGDAPRDYSFSHWTFRASTFQIFSRYSWMDRSEENLPIRATFRMDLRVHASWSR